MIFWKDAPLFNEGGIVYDAKHAVHNSKELLAKIYHKTPVGETDDRLRSTDVRVVVIKDENADYRMKQRAEGVVLVNVNGLAIKTKWRNTFSHLYFHTTDNVSEFGDVVAAFSLPDPFKKHVSSHSIVDMSRMRGIVWAVPPSRSYIGAKFTALPLSQTPHMDQNLHTGYVTDIEKHHIGVSLDSYDREKQTSYTIAFEIPNLPYYYIDDGLHRCATLFKNNFTHTFVRAKPYRDVCADYKINVNLFKSAMHFEQMHRFLTAADHVIMRGWRHLTNTPDTDIDVYVRNYDDMKRRATCKDGGLLLNVVQGEIVSRDGDGDGEPQRYIGYGTTAERMPHIHNTYYRIDMYSHVSFPFGHTKRVCSREFTEYLCDNAITHPSYSYRTPNPTAEAILIMCRVQYDKNSVMSDKHSKYLTECMAKVDDTSALKHFMQLEKISLNMDSYLRLCTSSSSS